MSYSGGRRLAGTVARWLAGCWAGCVAATTAAAVACLCLAVAPGVALAGGSLAGEGSGASSSSSSSSSSLGGASSLGSLLVIAGSPTQGEQVLAGERAKLADPEAVVAREVSRTKFEHLSASQAIRVADETFPGVIDRPMGEPPVLAAGQTIVGYPTDTAARIDLGGGKHGLIESSEPLATEISPGHREPIDLSLDESGGVFQPVRSGVGLRVPKRLADGVRLTGAGISLTPVDASGSALGGSEGVADGATVLYANTQTDSDTVVKPLATGFAEDTLLRSAQSPQQLRFHVSGPSGISVVLQRHGSGPVHVLEDGKQVALVPAPSARDAAGSEVPVSMGVSGDTIVLTVDHRAGGYEYPIDVDPTVEQSELEYSGHGYGFHWEFIGSSGFNGSASGGDLKDTSTIAQYGLEGTWGYETYGESTIYKLVSETSSTGTGLENELGIVRPPGKKEDIEVSSKLPGSYSTTKTELCTQSLCATGKVEAGVNASNVAYYEQIGKAENEKYGSFTSTMSKGTVYMLQESGPAATWNESSPTLTHQGQETTPNDLYGKYWMGPHRGAFLALASDPGMGLDEVGWSSPQSSTWSYASPKYNCIECGYTPASKPQEIYFYYNYECEENSCQYYKENSHLPEGEDKVEFKDGDPVGLTAQAPSVTLKVDSAPPYNLILTGLPPNKEIGDGTYHLKASATDGSGTTPSAGVESLVLKVNGIQVGSPEGSCGVPSGPCTASGEWAVSGSEFPVGQDEVSVTATDAAGNVTVEKYTMYVARPTTTAPVGPGQVNPQSGEFSLSSTDASVGGGDSTLSVGRSYGSMHLTEGSSGPLGPQWDLSVGATQNLTKLPDGDMLLTTGLGLQAVFASKGGGEFTAPKGDANLVLTEKTVEGKVEYFIKEPSGALTTFTLSSGGEGNLWLPTKREGANGSNSTTVSYQTVGSVVEPTEILAPKPAGVSSCTELVKGCRALKFVYSTKTTATGESQSEWGEYEGRLKEITFTAWEPVAGKMTTIAVASYLYDKQGRLRAEWNPQISPALKTTYGYDSSGRLTAVTQSGQQPWLLTYGTTAGDTRTGRLLAVTRPSASTATGSGVLPKNEAAPAVTGTMAIGSTLSVSTGTWSNSPLSYAYQWEACNSKGESCTPIVGATNSTYVIQQDVSKDYLVARVWATNSDGSGVAQSTVGAGVPSTETYYYPFGSLGSGPGEFNHPAGSAVDANGNVWVVDSGNNRIEEFTSMGAFIASYGSYGSGEGQFNKPTGIAINQSTGKIYVTDTGNDRVEVLESSGKYSTSFGSAGETNGTFKEPAGIAISIAYGVIFVADTGNNRVEAFSLSTNAYKWKFGKAGTGTEQFTKPQGIVTSGKSEIGGGAVYVSDTGNNRVEMWRTNTEGTSHETNFGAAGTGNGQFSGPVGLSFNESKLQVADSKNSRVETFTEREREKKFELEYFSQFGNSGAGLFGQFSSPEWISEQKKTSPFSSLYVTDTANNRVVIHAPSGSGDPFPEEPPVFAPAPPSPGTSAVTTIEYHVPLRGTYAPYAMGSSEVSAWGQTDDPSEATAIFPPDEPEGWPAQEYKRASVYYLDSVGRTVNVAEPGGAISTSEYNSTNDAVRTLSADNRAKALAEGSKSAEEAKKLDTESSYADEGGELESTLGPEHQVMLPGGSEASARARTKYFYNEGAPSEGGPYSEPTKTTNFAEVGGKEEDLRTTTMSYSGQENLGWKLRKPTSTTIDPTGLDLTHSASYEAATGNVTEATTPTGATENPPPAYALTFGSGGSGNGQFSHPMQDAVDSSGNVWVADGYNNRVEKFSSSGTFLAAYGKEGSSETELQFKEPVGIAINQSTGNVYVGDSKNNRVVEFSSSTGKVVRVFGKSGTGAGEFKEAGGVAIDSKGNVWVTDYANNRVNEFSETGTFIRVFGFGVSNGESKLEVCTSGCRAGLAGSGNGQFSGPSNVVISGENIYVTDLNNSRVEELNEEGKKFVRAWGSSGSGNGQFKYPSGVTVGSNGNVYVVDNGNARVQEFSSTGTFLTSFGTKGSGNGQLAEPEGVTVTSSGAIYVTDAGANNRVQEWVSNKGGAHTTQTIYYSAETNSKYPGCGGHAEWANLVCETKPAAQPATGGLPELPVTTFTYNVWDEVKESVETVGSTTRTHTYTYDAAGRLKTSATSSTVGTGLPTVTDAYNEKTGALEKQSTTTEGHTKTITSVYNSLGEMTSYTDADENATTYEYDIDGRPTKVNDGKGIGTYTYNETTGLLTGLVNEYGTTKLNFTATYDVEGNMTSEGLPNGMEVKYTRNAAGGVISQEDVKTTHCTEKCVWFSDAVTPSIHGQWLTQTSTLSHQAYTYDKDGRLTQVQNTPAGKGCTTRVYANDEDTNRTSLKTYEPNSKGECTTEGTPTAETHTYDTADRLTDAGTVYSTFGNITALPAADAGGSELTNTYYVDDQLASETQNGQTIGYNLDPTGRTRETVATGKRAEVTISNYAGPGSAAAWTINGSGEVTRNITGIGGSLAAVQSNGETPVLQLTNLHGDIIATAYLSETATGLASSADTSEFGVPTTSLPPKYSWLGADEIPTELASGVTNMGARSYVPELGRFLQPDPIPGGSANAYTYTFGDPVNVSDPSGEFAAWFVSFTVNNASEVLAEDAAREQAAKREAEEKADQARWAEEASASSSEGEEEEGEEWEEEESGYEEAAYHSGAGGQEGGHLEAGVLYQPLPEGVEYNAETTLGSVVPLCKAGEQGLCARSVITGPCNRCYGRRGRPHRGNSIGELWGWVTGNLHKLVAAGVGAISTVAVGGATALATTGCAASAAVSADPAEAFDCYKIAAFGVDLTFAVAASTYEAWKQEKN
jgi:RHS repeat-associated protein